MPSPPAGFNTVPGQARVRVTQAARFARIPGLFIPENQIGFSEDPAAFTNGKTSVGEHSTGAVHHRPFPKAALCFEAMLQPLRALAPADILFPHAALCLFGRKYLPSSATDCVSDASLQNRSESGSIGAHNNSGICAKARVRSCRPEAAKKGPEPLKVKLLRRGNTRLQHSPNYVPKYRTSTPSGSINWLLVA